MIIIETFLKAGGELASNYRNTNNSWTELVLEKIFTE